MKELFDIGNVLIELGSYKLSYLEAFSVATALVSVWLATKNNIHTWTAGLVSFSGFFWLFYQAQLYSDMLLQVFFFVTSTLGIISWKNPDKKINKVSMDIIKVVFLCVVTASTILGFVMFNVHTWIPDLFLEPAEFPFMDAFTTVLSVVATIFLIKRILQCWWFWIAVDVIATVIYFQRGLYVVSAEYLIFLGMAIYGLRRWNKTFQAQ